MNIVGRHASFAEQMGARVLIEVYAHNCWWMALAGISVNLILGHNLWLVAKGRAAGRGNGRTPVRVEANTSDTFPASESAVRPERVADFRLMSADGSSPVTDYHVEENSLVTLIEPPREGAVLVALRLHTHPITLEAEKFARYVGDEDAARRVAPHFLGGETTAPQRESYTKYAKALIESDAGGGDIFRIVVGHRLEIIPLLPPASVCLGTCLPVQVLFDGEPASGLRLSSGSENLGGGYIAHTKTDKAGWALVKLTTPGRWFVRTHHIRPHADSRTADWESFWSSLTFEVRA